jgi:hypothetical protein
MNRFGTLPGSAAAFVLGAAMVTSPALAGPCSADIAELTNLLNNPTGKGSGTLSGNAPGAITDEAPMPEETPAGPTGKERGTLAGNTPDAEGQVVDPTGGLATSPQDARLQQAGKPTTAQGGDPRALDAQREQAVAALAKARDLDARNDAARTTAVDEARELYRRGT